VRCIDGNVEVELICEPVFDYGRVPGEWSLVGDSRHVADASGAEQTIRLSTDMALGIEGNTVRARHSLKEGDELYCAVSWAEGLDSPADLDDAKARLVQTTRFWRTWLSRARLPDHEWMTPIQRSALAIKGLTYMPTGATVRALTTSLPETPGGERNWDYRTRGCATPPSPCRRCTTSTSTGRPTSSCSSSPTSSPTRTARCRSCTGSTGAAISPSPRVTTSPGYAGARPVRIGNGAFDQRQNDVFGATLDSILLHTRRSNRLPRRLWPIVQAQAECATAVWRQPDQGIWEARGDPQHYVSSKLMGWVALDRAAKLAHIAGEPALSATWARTAEEIKADILEHGVDGRGVLRQHYATDALDASTLLAALFGFLPRDDERLRASVLAIADELTEHGYVLRYKTGETDDGLSGKEGTFLICSFWLVSALAIIDERQRARDLMERLLAVASPLGLYAEEFDADTGRHLGNFPQAFSHLALIEAAGRIIAAERLEEFR
jgi:GH15 family glucan-1,4-alpha-glucosidase